ncbi:hypothetical protein O6H91_01G154600 [Diphasiastrum complanatum]|uniref:Uncharacterized protein n=1 Tax=Diphasiastrum complanatum TaxID=34168 RepID=A0ACC2EXF6_DIPCM|nr:hypothetical protein O6H91_01G154600 [Diphasiastrum complanatum]
MVCVVTMPSLAKEAGRNHSNTVPFNDQKGVIVLDDADEEMIVLENENKQDEEVVGVSDSKVEVNVASTRAKRKCVVETAARIQAQLKQAEKRAFNKKSSQEKKLEIAPCNDVICDTSSDLDRKLTIAKGDSEDSGLNHGSKLSASPKTEIREGSALSSDVTKVKNTIRIFNACYLEAVKEEEDRCRKGEADDNGKRASRRPDLQAISKMIKMKAILFPKQVGELPGIHVGDHFFSRAEMVAIGLHKHWLNGIDSIEVGKNKKVAVSIVMSGGYEDDVDNSEDVIYTGQGGNDLTGNRRQIKDQEMSRGNLALKNSIDEGNPVRVIRGHASSHSYSGRVYTYDGVYKVGSYWAEKGISGHTVYKYKLNRVEGQPVLTTDQVHFSRGKIPESLSQVRGLVSKDISNGLECKPVLASNVIDDPPVPPIAFLYMNHVELHTSIKLPSAAQGCSCDGQCVDPRKCICAKLNGNEFPYVAKDGGRLIKAKDVVFECGPNCGCGPGCVNRTTQHGLRYRLEVFRTPNKGWGVRSWDYIPAGAPICEYTGVVWNSEDLDNAVDNDFVFELDCMQTMQGVDGRQRRWGDVSKLVEEQLVHDAIGTKIDATQPQFSIDAGNCGSVARFVNHSCDPNLFVQCVLSSHHDVTLPRIVLFAADNIPPLQELVYDYGYALDSVVGADGKIKQMPCYCGAIDCRKRLY